MVESKPTSSVRYLDTATAYDLWSEVYDTDGNFLQALDTIEMQTLLPQLLSKVSTSKPWRIVDLGCGTGRNTLVLTQTDDVEVAALDLSPKMLDVARARFDEESHLAANVKLDFQVFDMMTASEIPKSAQEAHIVVSTLVVEHVPLNVFFGTTAKMLRPGGLLLVTNMHSEMGSMSQAGFVDPKTGDKVRPVSFAHTIEEVVQEAKHQGFQLVGNVIERSVDEGLAPRLGIRAGKWIGVKVWFAGVFQKD